MNEAWTIIEELLDSIASDVHHRCYVPQSHTGVRSITLLVKRHLIRIDELLLEQEMCDQPLAVFLKV